MTMTTSEKGITLITTYEGLSLKAYKVVSTEKYYTIGYGHYGKDVSAKMTITKDKALELLKTDLKESEAQVNKYQSIYNFNQNQFDALVSFAYNVGNIKQLTANGTRTIDQIAKCILLYNKSGGKVLAGLKARRKAEQTLFMKSSSTNYYDKYVGSSKSIDIIFRSIGVPEKYLGSWSARIPIANANGIKYYVGNTDQNSELIKLAKNGILKRVV